MGGGSEGRGGREIGWSEFGKDYSDSLVWEVSCGKPRQVCAREESYCSSLRKQRWLAVERVDQKVDLRCAVSQMRLVVCLAAE